MKLARTSTLRHTITLVLTITIHLGHAQSPLHAAAVTTSGDHSGALSLQQLQRCSGVRGSICSAYYAQKLGDLQQPGVYEKPCPINPTHDSRCGLGVCHGDTGLCDCPAGVGGPDCGSADVRPCTNQYRADRNSSTPASHIGPNKRDIDWKAPGFTPSRCAGVCDDATATCYCDGAHFGRVPALPGSTPGSPPIRPGRLLLGNCQRLITDDAGRPLHWGGAGGMKYEDIYGAQGWCTVDKPIVRCSCDLDGFDGQLCEAVTETVCPNQCSGHGTCMRGFCKCFAGWFGLDCARLADPSALNPASAAAAAVSSAAGEGASQDTSTAAADNHPAGQGPRMQAGTEAAGSGGKPRQDASTPNDSTGSGSSSSTAEVESTVDSIASAEQERQQRQQPAKPTAEPVDDDTAARPQQDTASQLPEHIRYLMEKPYLSQLIVDPWFSSTPRDPVTEAAAVAASTDAAAEGGPRAIPRLYFTPVSSDGQDSTVRSSAAAAAAAAAGKAVEGSGAAEATAGGAPDGPWLTETRRHRVGALQRHRRGRKHYRGLRAEGSSNEQQFVPLQQQQEQQEGGPTLLRRPQQQQQQPEHTPGFLRTLLQYTHLLPAEQQQQQQQGHSPHFLRTLLRHFWTGGGSQRAELTVAPKQSTVTAAVQYWLSHDLDSSSNSNGGHSSSNGGSSNGGSSSSSSDHSSSRMAGVGLADALVGAGVQMERLGSGRDAALLQQMVERALGEVPVGKVRRPRIFVYDMPSRFVSRLLQYRSSKATCTWRVFSKSNFSLFTTTDTKSGWRYPLESHLHELLLQSPHRTLDPEEADFFYVPVYASCMMEAVAGWADAPWWSTYSKSHVKQGVLMYQDALDWIRTTYPYWNASQGRNHVWLFGHDEGACWAPSEIYNNSLILTQWGRLGSPSLLNGWACKYGPVMESWTSKWEQNWNKWHASNDDPLGLQGREDYLQLLTDHPCYNPSKDLVLPAFRPPPLFRASPFMGGDSRRERDILVLLRGDMGKGRQASFSQGVRQQLTRLTSAGDWKRRYNVWIGTPQDLPGEQSALLARSRYCLVVPIDGWSGTFEDAVLHGCIPVVVNMDKGIAQPFSTLLKLSSGMLHIARSDLPDLPAILKAIPPAEEDALRAALHTWWHRMAWMTHPFVRSQAAEIVQGNLQRHPWVRYGVEQQLRQRSQALAGMGRNQETAGPSSEDDEGLLVPVLPTQTADDTSVADQGDNSTSSDVDNSSGSSGAANATADSSATYDGVSGDEEVERVLSEAEKVAELFKENVWQEDAVVDDAFTTLMQWLHHKLHHPYDPSSHDAARPGSHHLEHSRPTATAAAAAATTATTTATD